MAKEDFDFDFEPWMAEELIHRSVWEEWYEAMLEILPLWDVNTIPRVAGFIAQCGHESGGFKAVSENLNYSADGLKKIFPKYFPGNLNESYARQPEKIANRVYADRMGNGAEASGDGWKYRGRGALQLTGKSNYKAFSDYLKNPLIMEQPDLVANEFAFESAMFFFEKNGLWSICDKGVSKDTILALTKRVNGGTIGLADRIKHFKEFHTLLV